MWDRFFFISIFEEDVSGEIENENELTVCGSFCNRKIQIEVYEKFKSKVVRCIANLRHKNILIGENSEMTWPTGDQSYSKNSVFLKFFDYISYTVLATIIWKNCNVLCRYLYDNIDISHLIRIFSSIILSYDATFYF